MPAAFQLLAAAGLVSVEPTEQTIDNGSKLKRSQPLVFDTHSPEL